jgi:anti-sigma B factor antagonist
MKANIIKDAQGQITIQMEGDLTFDTTQALRIEIDALAKSHRNSKMFIDMSAVDFVGASGIGHFVETLKIIKDKTDKIIQLINVHSDFQKVFKLYGLQSEFLVHLDLGMEDDETRALNQVFGNRSRTFEN